MMQMSVMSKSLRKNVVKCLLICESLAELRSCVKVKADVLDSTSLIICMISVDVKQHLKKKKKEEEDLPAACHFAMLFCLILPCCFASFCHVVLPHFAMLFCLILPCCFCFFFSVRGVFVSVRVSDLQKDVPAVNEYLVDELNFSPEAASALLSSTYSIRVVGSSSAVDFIAWMAQFYVGIKRVLCVCVLSLIHI